MKTKSIIAACSAFALIFSGTLGLYTSAETEKKDYELYGVYPDDFTTEEIEEIESTGKLEVVKGDADGNGVINTADIVFLKSNILNLEKKTVKQLMNSDINLDGVIDSEDIIGLNSVFIDFKVTPKPVETPQPTQTPKPTEQPKPVETPQPTEEPVQQRNPKDGLDIVVDGDGSGIARIDSTTYADYINNWSDYTLFKMPTPDMKWYNETQEVMAQARADGKDEYNIWGTGACYYASRLYFNEDIDVMYEDGLIWIYSPSEDGYRNSCITWHSGIGF